jgi:hypothetical protein
MNQREPFRSAVRVGCLFSLSPVLGGEGRGEGDKPSRSNAQVLEWLLPPHPIPLPLRRGRGDQSVQPPPEVGQRRRTP